MNIKPRQGNNKTHEEQLEAPQAGEIKQDLIK